MYKLKNPLQKDDGIRNEWYVNDYFDLVVWFDEENDDILGFQLCYDKLYNEHSLTYKKNGRIQHNKIESSFSFNGSPLVIANGEFKSFHIVKKFENDSINIDSHIREEVLNRLNEYIQ